MYLAILTTRSGRSFRVIGERSSDNGTGKLRCEKGPAHMKCAPLTGWRIYRQRVALKVQHGNSPGPAMSHA